MWETLWTFKTAHFTVKLECAPEDCPDLSWMGPADLKRIESGEWVNVTFRVRVLMDGHEIGSDYLGNSVYADVHEFAREHRTGTAYFPDMVRQSVSYARSELKKLKA